MRRLVEIFREDIFQANNTPCFGLDRVSALHAGQVSERQAMNRRIFLKLLGISPVIPSVLMAKEKSLSLHEQIMRATDKPLTATEILNLRKEYCGRSPMAETLPEVKAFNKNAKLGIPYTDTDAYKDTIFNGQVFKAPWPLCHEVVVMYNGRGDEWVLVYISDGAEGWNVPNICHYEREEGGYSPVYNQEQLQRKLKTWKLVKDKELRLV